MAVIHDSLHSSAGVKLYYRSQVRSRKWIDRLIEVQCPIVTATPKPFAIASRKIQTRWGNPQETGAVADLRPS